MRTATVYALVDPRDLTVKYIGSTVDTAARLRYHLSTAKGLSKQLRDAAGVWNFPFAKTNEAERVRWLAEILDSGLEPIMLTLAVLPEREARDAERDFIQVFAAHTSLLQRRDIGINWRPIHEIDRALDAKELQAQTAVQEGPTPPDPEPTPALEVSQ